MNFRSKGRESVAGHDGRDNGGTQRRLEKCYFCYLLIYLFNNIHKKLLDSDWLKKECSFYVTPVQITNGF